MCVLTWFTGYECHGLCGGIIHRATRLSWLAPYREGVVFPYMARVPHTVRQRSYAKQITAQLCGWRHAPRRPECELAMWGHVMRCVARSRLTHEGQRARAPVCVLRHHAGEATVKLRALVLFAPSAPKPQLLQ